MAISSPKGMIPSIVRNDDGLYEGDLIHYFKVVFFQAQNIRHPYHNFRHMLHVMVKCHDACDFYRDQLSPREMRNLLIAALFHDFDHSGLLGSDDLNIMRAVRAEFKYLLDDDSPWVGDIGVLIGVTKYPHDVPTEELTLRGQILRDADMCQALSVAWIQDVVIGLSAEWRISPLEALKREVTFLENLSFFTKWGKDRFPQTDIDAKAAEARELLEILESSDAAAA